jgi:hypothetical protein
VSFLGSALCWYLVPRLAQFSGRAVSSPMCTPSPKFEGLRTEYPSADLPVSRLVMPWVVTATCMRLSLRCAPLRARALGTIGARLRRGTPTLWPGTSALRLSESVSARFLTRHRTIHAAGRIVLMGQGAILGATIRRSARARSYDTPAVEVPGARGGRNRRPPMVL